MLAYVPTIEIQAIANTWIHLAVVDLDLPFALYYNGALYQKTWDLNPGPNDKTRKEGILVIGKSHGNEYASLVIDELSFFDDNLSAEQIAKLYNM